MKVIFISVINHVLTHGKPIIYVKNHVKKKQTFKEKLLENPERKATDEDVFGIFTTLTSAQKNEMLLHMMAICYARSDKTVKGIYQIIDGLSADRKNKKTFYVSDL